MVRGRSIYGSETREYRRRFTRMFTADERVRKNGDMTASVRVSGTFTMVLQQWIMTCSVGVEKKTGVV